MPCSNLTVGQYCLYLVSKARPCNECCLVFQPGVVGQMIEAAEERPWLWVVYILTVALPVFLVILFCCSGKKQASPVEYKKTDAPQPDVKEDEEEKEEEKEKGDEEEEGEEKLEEKQKSDVEEDGDTVSQEEEDRKPKAEVIESGGREYILCFKQLR